MRSGTGLSTVCHIVLLIDAAFSFEYEVYVTSDNSIFTCYSFLWKSENDYHIIVPPGQIMKGSRIKSDESHSSGKSRGTVFPPERLHSHRLGEPLLVQKRTATSSNSRPNTSTSATFDQIDQSSDHTSTDDNGLGHTQNDRSPVCSLTFDRAVNHDDTTVPEDDFLGFFFTSFRTKEIGSLLDYC